MEEREEKREREGVANVAGQAGGVQSRTLQHGSAEKLANPEEAIKMAIQKLAAKLENADNADRIGELIDKIGKAVDVLERIQKVYRNR